MRMELLLQQLVPYSNLTLKEARAKIIEDLNTAGLIDRVEDIVHRTPLCERSKTPIEIIPMEDYYLKQLKYIPKLKELARKLHSILQCINRF